MNDRRPFGEMDRMFGPMWTDLSHGLGPDPDESRYDANVTMERTDGGLLVMADLPGFEKEEIDLTYEDGVLAIEATHESTRGGDHVQFSRSRSVFEQARIPYAEDVLVDEVEASYRNGVLEVHVPVAGRDDDDDEHRIDID